MAATNGSGGATPGVPGELEPSPFKPQVETLLAMVGEMLDEELLAATKKLHEAAADHDEADLRFVAAGNELRRLLLEKLPRLS